MKKIKPKYNPVSTLNNKRKEYTALPAKCCPLSSLPLEAGAESWCQQSPVQPAVCEALTGHDPVGGAEPREHAVDGREPAGFRGHVAPQLGHDHQETSLHSKQRQAHLQCCLQLQVHTHSKGTKLCFP